MYKGSEPLLAGDNHMIWLKTGFTVTHAYFSPINDPSAQVGYKSLLQPCPSYTNTSDKASRGGG